jgi:hypothetical protein
MPKPQDILPRLQVIRGSGGMKTERTLEEIKAHRHEILPDAENYRIIRCNIDADFSSGTSTLVMTLAHKESRAVRKLRFENVSVESPVLVALKDADGLYFMDTRHLGWSESQRVEVGDWDGGPPLFWAETVSQIEGH